MLVNFILLENLVLRTYQENKLLCYIFYDIKKKVSFLFI
jgi:hypothetical protein